MDASTARRRGRIGRLLVSLTTSALIGSGAVPAHAATMGVTTTEDELNADGDCSLREALHGAALNTAVDACPAGSGADLVSLPAGTYTLTSPETLSVSGDTSVVGAGADATIVDGGGLTTVFTVANGPRAVIANLTIRNGLARLGGGGVSNGGNLTLDRVIVTGNRTTDGYGGAVFTAAPPSSRLDVINSTIVRNDSLQGGGLYVFSNARLFLSNSTVIDNGGGGIYRYSGYVYVADSTIVANPGQGVGNGVDGMTNTILWGNGSDCGWSYIVSNGYNLLGDVTGCLMWGPGTGDVYGADPLLGPLQDNGGITPTLGLLAGSPAIDAGRPDCPPPAADQRGIARPQGSGCDIGAYEFVYEILPGFDLFSTDPDRTRIDPDGPGPLPAAHFQGVPLGSYDFGRGARPVGSTDTIVRRPQRASGGTIPIELVALSLVSVDPIPGVPTQVYVTLQKDRGVHSTDPPSGPPSVGTLHISFARGGAGGTFSSSLHVYFDLRAGSPTGPIIGSGTLPTDEVIASDSAWGREPVPARALDEVGQLIAHGVVGPSALLPGVNDVLNGTDRSADFHAGR